MIDVRLVELALIKLPAPKASERSEPVASVFFFDAPVLARLEAGAEKYGAELCTFNGRRALVDLYQEILDAQAYAAQAMLEGDHRAMDLVRDLAEIRKKLETIL